MRGEQAIFNLEIKKKSGLSINPDRLINLEIYNKQYLIWRLRKREDQALISISTILKFSAQNTCFITIGQ